jgi:hypothetical protein
LNSSGDIVARLREFGVGRRGAFDLARIRTNSSLNPERGWHLLQWLLTAGSQWTSKPLDDELNPDCYRSSAGNCARFYEIWDEIEANPTLTRRPVAADSGLLLAFKAYSSSSGPMPVPIGKSNIRPRNVLALQQCSQCHRPETGVNFLHIENKLPGAKRAELSKFLKGEKIDATYDELLPQDTDSKYKVTITVEHACASRPCSTSEVVRTFHDLGRRRLFLAAVLISRRFENEADRKLIEEYAVDFAH